MKQIGMCSHVFAAILFLASQNVLGASDERIVEIAFEGNEKTQESVLRREIPVAVGDVLDADVVELSRQQIQNLGLFRAVEARTERVDGGVRLVFSVKEKWFWQGYPRLSANSDGQNSVGFEGRVSNLWGLNHSVRLLGRSRDTKDEDRGRDLSIRGSYYAPYLLGERDSLRLSAAHSITPYEDPDYDETVNEFEVLASRTFGLPQQHSQGWTLGLGTIWRDQQVSDESITPSFGSSYGLVTEATYRNERDLIYSNEGSFFSARYEIADQDLFSDYSYSILRVSMEQARPIGEREHQQLNYGLTFGIGNHGLDHRALFSLGGAEGLRGYERKAFEGNSFYLANVEFMRPLYWDSLRGTIGLEMGNAAWETKDLFNSPNISLNLGLRYKPRRLINFEIELGFAIPLSGDDPRFYGGKVDRH